MATLNSGLLIGCSPDEVTALDYAFSEWSVNLTQSETLAQAIAIARKRMLRVIVTDLELADWRGIGIVPLLLQHGRGTPVIVLVRPGEEELGAQCVQAGATSFVVKHPEWIHDLAPLREAVSTVLVAPLQEVPRRVRRGPGRVTAFVGAKGGVGTTTVALSAALLSAQAGTDTILAELRPSRGSLAPALRLAPKANLSALAHLEAGAITPRDVERCLVRVTQNLRVLFAPQLAPEFGELPADKAHAVVRALAQLADAVVLDLPCGGCASNQVAAHESEAVHLVMDTDPTALLPAEATLSRLKRWRLPAGRVSLVLTTRLGLATPLMPSQVTDRLGLEVTAWVPQLSHAQLKQLEHDWAQALDGDSTFALALRPGVVERLTRAADGEAHARYRFVIGRPAIAG